jgi:hypothetical protein
MHTEASQASIINPYVKGVETETLLVLSKISEQKEILKNILKKYNVETPDDIEKMIERGDIEEHPAYEDYLSALAYEQNIKELKEMLGNLVKRI